MISEETTTSVGLLIVAAEQAATGAGAASERTASVCTCAKATERRLILLLLLLLLATEQSSASIARRLTEGVAGRLSIGVAEKSATSSGIGIGGRVAEEPATGWLSLIAKKPAARVGRRTKWIALLLWLLIVTATEQAAASVRGATGVCAKSASGIAPEKTTSARSSATETTCRRTGASCIAKETTTSRFALIAEKAASSATTEGVRGGVGVGVAGVSAEASKG